MVGKHNANRKTTLKLRRKIAGFDAVKSACGDKKHMLRREESVARADRRAFNNRQEVALDAHSRNVGLFCLGADNLVDLVNKDDAQILGKLHSAFTNLILVKEFVEFVVKEDPARLRDRRLVIGLTRTTARQKIGKHVGGHEVLRIRHKNP